ncbi:unnamed protein product, partial [Mesorhabditis belari]|uniref:EGF-like domain-containing protein n=1 Tax=Mesorhabditis belari TaxID=2138241 RepID=A0AAF3FCD0_9BILA
MRFRRQLEEITSAEGMNSIALRCEEMICYNGGECIRIKSTFGGHIEMCKCALGFEGQHCEDAFDINRHTGNVAPFTQVIYETVSYSAFSFFVCMAFVTVLVAVYAYRRVSRQMVNESFMWWEKSFDSSGTKSSPGTSFYLQRSGGIRSPLNRTNESFASDVVSRVPESFFRKQSMLQQDRLLGSANRSMASRISDSDTSRQVAQSANLEGVSTSTPGRSDLVKVPVFHLPTSQL